MYFHHFKKIKINSWLVGFLGLFFLTSCSLRSIIVNQLEPVVDEMQKSILAESEPQLVDGTLPFAIKFTESLHRYYPTSPYYSSKLSLLYSAYTFSYIDHTPFSDFDDEGDMKIAHITQLYQRAFQYGLKSLEARHEGFSQKIFQTDQVDLLLKKIEVEDVEALFWFNFSWALKLFYNLDDVASLIHFETIKKIADRIDELNPNYLFGVNKAIFIAYYGGRSDTLGGSLKQAKHYYQKSLSFSEGKSLVNDFVYLKFVTIQSGNEEEFNRFYQRIINFDLTQNQKFYFVNRIIQDKAKILYQKKDQFF